MASLDYKPDDRTFHLGQGQKTGPVKGAGTRFHKKERLDTGEIIEDIIGSTWTEKLPKDVIMERLLETLGAKGENVIVVGDGRSEISAGVKMGALCVSRLGKNEEYKRALHKRLGTDIIIESFNDPDFRELMK